MVRWAITAVAASLLWWWTPFTLLCGRVRSRALLFTGVLTAACLLVLGGVSSVYLPRAIRSQERQFGTIGAVFAIESWLVVLGGTVVAAAVVGAVAAQYPGPIGRLVRGSSDPTGWLRPLPGLHKRGGRKLLIELPTSAPPDQSDPAGGPGSTDRAAPPDWTARPGDRNPG